MDQRIPRSIDGLPTDVIETGKIKFLGFAQSNPAHPSKDQPSIRTQRVRPAQPGVSNDLWRNLLQFVDDSGEEVMVVVKSQGTGISVDLNALKIVPWMFIKIRSGTSAIPVSQTQDRSILISLKSQGGLVKCH